MAKPTDAHAKLVTVEIEAVLLACDHLEEHLGCTHVEALGLLDKLFKMDFFAKATVSKAEKRKILGRLMRVPKK
jgi:hypothetical protein